MPISVWIFITTYKISGFINDYVLTDYLEATMNNFELQFRPTMDLHLF